MTRLPSCSPDVRRYKALCERLKPDEVTELVQDFYETSSAALLAHEGLLGQIAGDEIEDLFVPGLAGPNYRRKAVEAARSLVRAIRYTESGAGSLEVGARAFPDATREELTLKGKHTPSWPTGSLRSSR